MVDLAYLKSNVFPGESGGDYNALFGYANRGSGPFGGIKLTDMTINQVLDFTDPRGPYAQSVKGQIGRVATPTGAYQVVGRTLRDAVRGLGLTGNEVYDEGTQDRIGQWIYENQGPNAWEAWGKGGNGDKLAGGGGDVSLLGGTQDFSGDANMEPERKGLLGFLGDDEKRARLSLALSGLSMFPNEGVMQLARDTIMQARQQRADQAAQAKIDEQTNKTLQFIANLKTPQAQQALQYAQGTGDVAGALKMAMETTPAPDLPASVDEYKFAVTQGYTGTFFDYQKEMADAKRAQTNVTVGGASEYGTIPQGYMMVTDPVTGAKSLAPIPGGPAAIEAEAEEAKAAQRRGMADAATQTIVSTAAKAREAAEARTLTGPLGSLAAINPATQNAEMYRQVESLKSQAALENINAMRAASPTGGALGGATDADMLLLKEKSGALDPRSPNFLRDLDDYELTLLQTIHGFVAGTQIFNQTRGGSAGTNSGTNIGDVTVGEPY